MVDSETSLELWTNLEQSLDLKLLLNSMSIIDFFGKLKTITDELAIVGNHFSSLDFLTHLISSLGQPYYPLAAYFEANLAKMTVSEAYFML